MIAMNVDVFRKRLSKTLAEKFKVNQVTTTPLGENNIHSSHNWVGDIHVFEFIINDSERYFCFGTMKNNNAYFTRAKEGILEHLAGLIRPQDFIFQMTGDYSSRHDVVGKLIECRINQNARNVLEQYFEEWNTKPLSYSTTFGFKVNRHHKTTMTFDCEFELLVKGPLDMVFKSYHGTLINGEVDTLVNADKVQVNPEDIFI